MTTAQGRGLTGSMESKIYIRFLIGLSTLAAFIFTTGCEGTRTSSAAADRQMTTQVGQYSPPPAGLVPVRVGVPAFEVEPRSGAAEDMSTVAADILTTLATNSGRFRVIERAQLRQLTREQGLGDVVREDEVTEMGQVRGVDYLILGRITNLRVQKSKDTGGFGLGTVRFPGGGGFGGFDLNNTRSQIDVECGVDIRMVDPETGEVVAAEFSEYNRTDSIANMGVSVLGVSAGSDTDLDISEDDQGRILRLALDEAMRKMMPRIDTAIQQREQVGSEG